MPKAPADAPWGPARWDEASVANIQALAKGDALPHQQTAALKYIVEEICKTYDLSFRSESQRETDFAEGKRFVGLQIVKLTKLNLGAISGRRKSSSRDPSRDPDSESSA